MVVSVLCKLLNNGVEGTKVNIGSIVSINIWIHFHLIPMYQKSNRARMIQNITTQQEIKNFHVFKPTPDWEGKSHNKMYRRIGPAFIMNISYFISLLKTTPLFYFDKFIVVCYLFGHNRCYAIVNQMKKQSLSGRDDVRHFWCKN